MSEPVKTEPDDCQDGRESPSFEGLLDPDTVDGEKQEVEPKSVSVNSRNKMMGAAALAVLLIVGVSVVAWHFTKQERKLLMSFSSNFGNLVFGCFGQQSYQNIM
jgi:uncharacterized protein HemX